MSKFLVLLLAVLCLAPAAKAQISGPNEKKLAEALSEFEKGAYSQAITLAEGVKADDNESRAAVAFFIATTYAKMQNFDQAIPYYRTAIDNQSDAKSLHYDYGQALFATRSFRDAEREFRRSIAAHFKIAASAYYVGYIRQVLEDPEGAKEFYDRIQKIPGDPDEVKQPALFQIAEIEKEALDKTEPKEKRVRLEAKKLTPLYERARDFQPDSDTGREAAGRLAELETALEEYTLKMMNGNPIPKKPYIARLTQALGYNSNVTSQADDPIVSVAHHDAPFSTTGIFANYQWNIAHTVSVSPELFSNLTYYIRGGEPSVYAFDNFTVTPALRTKYEHMSGGNPATFLADYEFNYTGEDYTKAHQDLFYSRYQQATLGERVNWFATGSTTLKIALKLYQSEDPSYNDIDPSISLQQNFRVLGGREWRNTFTADYLRARNDFDDEKNYKLQSAMDFYKVFHGWDLSPSLIVNLKDTMAQKGGRGNETLLNPSLAGTHELGGAFDLAIEYDFTKNFSLNKNYYQYTQHIVKATLGCSF